jgi:hypothetical protein
MATFGRTARQDVLWDEFNDIRATVDKGLLSPDDAEYDGDDAVALQTRWDEVVTEYEAIHETNSTFG